MWLVDVGPSLASALFIQTTIGLYYNTRIQWSITGWKERVAVCMIIELFVHIFLGACREVREGGVGKYLWQDRICGVCRPRLLF